MTYDLVDRRKSCDRTSIIAYNTMNDPAKKVYLCGSRFDPLPPHCSGTGEQSKEKILAHEWTHVFVGISDYDHGFNECKQLAKSRQLDALRNAEDYALFYCKAQ